LNSLFTEKLLSLGLKELRYKN